MAALVLPCEIDLNVERGRRPAQPPVGLDFCLPSVLNIGGMGASTEVQVTVTFGPTSSLLLPRAVAHATRHSGDCAEISPGVWRASFDLGLDPEPYARAHRLIRSRKQL